MNASCHETASDVPRMLRKRLSCPSVRNSDVFWTNVRVKDQLVDFARRSAATVIDDRVLSAAAREEVPVGAGATFESSRCPSPPMSESSPVLPTMSSSPGPPMISSSPAPAISQSLPGPPSILSSPSRPIAWSSPSYASRTSALWRSVQVVVARGPDDQGHSLCRCRHRPRQQDSRAKSWTHRPRRSFADRPLAYRQR